MECTLAEGGRLTRLRRAELAISGKLVNAGFNFGPRDDRVIKFVLNRSTKLA